MPPQHPVARRRIAGANQIKARARRVVRLSPRDGPPSYTSRSELLQTATTPTSPRGAVSTTGVVTVRGQHRRSADVVAELMDVLADEPRVVACDLAGMAAEGSAMLAEGFAPVGEYLAQWPGTVVMAYAPDPQVRSRLHTAMSGERLRIHISRDAAGTEPHQLLPPLQRHILRLEPGPAAPDEARTFVAQTLVAWQLSHLVASAGEVAAEVTAGTPTDSTTGLDLMLSRIDDRVRIAVRDHQPQLSAPAVRDLPPSPLTGSRLRLVQTLARAWGVIPAHRAGKAAGKTVWVVLDTLTGHQHAAHTHPHQPRAAHATPDR
jgi:hypothetical protein